MWSDGVKTATRQDINVLSDIRVTAIFNKIHYNVTYAAGENGTIVGEVVQSVVKGGNGSYVTAMANSGYEFVEWSDGVNTVTRRENNVLANKSVIATFVVVLPENTTEFAGGSGSWGNPYKITDKEHIANMEKYPSAHFILINNIDLPTVGAGLSNHTPLFDVSERFSGNFNGKGMSINNLTIYNNTTFYSGLFGGIGRVYNLKLNNATVSGTNLIGAIAGYSCGEISGCEVLVV